MFATEYTGAHNSSYSIFKSEGEREGKRTATRQYVGYGEEPRSAADKVIRI